MAFVGAGDGFVSIWYDQSGNGYNFFQTTASLQPSIVTGGVIRVGVVGKKPALKFAIQGFKNLTNLIKPEHSIFVTSMSDSLGLCPLISQWSSGVPNRLLYALNQNSSGIQENNKMNFFIDGVTNGAGFGGYMLEGNISNTSFKLLTSLSSTGSENFKMYIDTALVDSATISDVNSTIPTAIGYSDQNSTPNLSSFMNELIIYNSNKSSDRTGIESNINSFYSIYATDVDAQAFITAAAITNTTQQTAINTLVNDLKTANIWTKMKAIYPFVGGTAAQHRFNLKDPRAVDAAYYLTFYGGGTHSSTGYLPNGNSYANTKLMPSVLSTNSQHLSYYSRTQIISNQIEIGANNLANNNFLGIYYSPTSGLRTSLASGTRTNIAIPSTNTQGFFMSNRPSSTYINIWKNNSKLTTDNITSTGNDNAVMYIGAVNGTTIQYSTKESAFASIGDGLTDAEATAFYTAVQAYQVALGGGRAV